MNCGLVACTLRTAWNISTTCSACSWSMMNIAAQQRPVLCAPSLTNVKHHELPEDQMLYSVLHIIKVTYTGLYEFWLTNMNKIDDLFRLLYGMLLIRIKTMPGYLNIVQEYIWRSRTYNAPRSVRFLVRRSTAASAPGRAGGHHMNQGCRRRQTSW